MISMRNALRYYDVKGLTWERQAFVKARPAAGDRELGEEFLRELSPWVYRRYLSLSRHRRNQGAQAEDREASGPGGWRRDQRQDGSRRDFETSSS